MGVALFKFNHCLNKLLALIRINHSLTEKLHPRGCKESDVFATSRQSAGDNITSTADNTSTADGTTIKNSARNDQVLVMLKNIIGVLSSYCLSWMTDNKVFLISSYACTYCCVLRLRQPVKYVSTNKPCFNINIGPNEYEFMWIHRSFPGFFSKASAWGRKWFQSPCRVDASSGKTLTMQFNMLNENTDRTPTASSELTLLLAGMGRHTITLPESANHFEVNKANHNLWTNLFLYKTDIWKCAMST